MYGYRTAPFAQLRAPIIGHIISTLAFVCVTKLFSLMPFDTFLDF